MRLLVVVLAITALVIGQDWTQIPGSLVQVATSVAYTWGVDASDRIFMCERPCTTWRQIGGRLRQLDVDDTHVYGVNAANNVFIRPIDGSDKWRYVDPTLAFKLHQVSASGNGYVWGVALDNTIHVCRKPCRGEFTQVEGLARQVDGGHSELYTSDEDNNIYARPINGSGWWRVISADHSKNYVTASGGRYVFALGANNNKIYFCRAPCTGEWDEVPTVSGVPTDGVPSVELDMIDASATVLVGIDRSDDSIWQMDLPIPAFV